ncbi:MAG: HEAT repeat domain-containing protein [Desulfobacterales bacterium]|jgi:hypothetical protein
MNQIPIRELKKKVLVLLQGPDFAAALEAMSSFPPRRIVNPLFSFLYHGDPLIRWRAVTALGAVTASLAEREMESARVVFRRLMWNLNDESGGIGWGSPEVMGEILARHRELRGEYLSIFLSYLRPEGNYLEHEGLQQGLLWGAGRVAQAAPDSILAAAPLIEMHLDSTNSTSRGAAAWSCGCMGDRAAASRLEALVDDTGKFDLFEDLTLYHTTVGRTARRALAKM